MVEGIYNAIKALSSQPFPTDSTFINTTLQDLKKELAKLDHNNNL